MINFNISITPL